MWLTLPYFQRILKHYLQWVRVNMGSPYVLGSWQIRFWATTHEYLFFTFSASKYRERVCLRYFARKHVRLYNEDLRLFPHPTGFLIRVKRK